MKKGRLFATAAVSVAVIAGIAVLPLPHYVWAVVEVVPHDAERVFVDSPGHLEKKYVEEGSWVAEGAVLARLRNPTLELKIAELRGDLESFQAQVHSIERLKHNDPNAGRRQLELLESITMIREKLAEMEQQQERLMVKAPRAGFVFAPPRKPDQAQPGELRTWIGTPLSDKNLGALLDEQVQLCEVGDPTRFEAQLVIDQSDFTYVTAAAARRAREGEDSDVATVRIKLDALPYQTLHSAVEEIAQIDYENVSRSLSNQQGGLLPTVTDPKTGQAKPLSTSYQARAPLANETGVLRNGMRGQAKIFVGYQPLSVKLWRTLARTFYFKIS